MSRPRQLSSLVQATVRLSLSTPSATAARPTVSLPLDSSLSAQRRHASWSISSLLPSFRGKKRSADDTTPAAAADSAQPGKAIKSDQPKGLFDAAVEGEEVQEIIRQGQGPAKQATFHKSSTANFKTSRRKLNDLSRLIAGLGADEAILQLKVSPKKQASRLLSMLALARDHAIAKGLSRDRLVVAQSWTTPGPSLQRLDIKGRGRYGVKHHPSSKLHVLLAEGLTDEEKRRQRKQDQWRRSLRGLTEGDGVGVGRSKPVINTQVGGWKW
ncbi:ribosomal protein L22/L17 [Leucosporidium creatinivorum]|uniref:Ribosomal protein L22/L17 n=1 Tax=Leucosporidium creatinivorum TaxID=106004 RepID=A0A1Y2F0P0_9BASI|nr:ribosomal protein L22/L17 [Leucosporidium creatinivorum]